MNKKIAILILFWLFFASIPLAKAQTQGAAFRIMTKSDSGDYIGQNKSWDFSNANNSKISIQNASDSLATFRTEDFAVSYMTFGFASESGKSLAPGLYYPAKRLPFRDAYNGIDISGDGRGCNTILGAFYVHEYALNNGTLEKAAIDFVQICEPNSTDLYNNTRPKLYGSLRYNSDIPDSCDVQGCTTAKKNLGFTDKPATKFRIMTQSESGDYIGQNKSWDFSDVNNSKVSITKSTDSQVFFNAQNFSVSYMNFEFDTETGKTLSPGLYVPAKRYPFNDSYNGINISGDGRGCNTILGAFYVHEYSLINGNLEKAAIDFVQTCEPGSTELYSNTMPKLYGSVRYNSTIPDSCDVQGCATAKKNLGFPEKQVTVEKPDLVINGVNLPSATDKRVIIEVRNAGTAATSFSKGIKVSASAINSNGALIALDNSGYQYLNNLSPNGVLSATFNVIGEMTSTITLKIWLDNAENGGSGFIDESNENNNTLVKTITNQNPNFASKYSGKLIKAYDSGAIYRVTEDGKRDVIPDNYSSFTGYKEAVLNSNGWRMDDVITVPQSEAESLSLGRNITIKAGSPYLLKKYAEELYYIVENSNNLKQVEKNNYNNYTLVIIPDAYFVNYYVISGSTDNSDQNQNIEEKNNTDAQISSINTNAKKLNDGKIDELLDQIKQLRDQLREQAAELKYLKTFTTEMRALNANMQTAIKAFITYGVDDNTKKLGEGERAAVINSYKSAFDKLPETESELADAIKIANGRWPSVTSAEAEKKAKEQFQKIYKRIADMNDPQDNAAITVMAYGLRQKAENRNLNSEKQGINTFKSIYGHVPSSTEDWNIMQAITYSGSSRGIDTDGDLLIDSREQELGTDPKNKDTDDDGYIDGIEVANGFDPLKK